MSMMIGAAAPSNSVANMAGSLAIMLFLLFGGFLLNKDQVPWYCAWIAGASFFNYAYEALAVRPPTHPLSPISICRVSKIGSYTWGTHGVHAARLWAKRNFQS